MIAAGRSGMRLPGCRLVKPGQVGVNSGTSLTFQTLTPKPTFDPDCHTFWKSALWGAMLRKP